MLVAILGFPANSINWWHHAWELKRSQIPDSAQLSSREIEIL